MWRGEGVWWDGDAGVGVGMKGVRGRGAGHDLRRDLYTLGQALLKLPPRGTEVELGSWNSQQMPRDLPNGPTFAAAFTMACPKHWQRGWKEQNQGTLGFKYLHI